MHHDSLLLEPKVIIFRAIKLSSLAVNIFELIIDRQHPDGGLYSVTTRCVFVSFISKSLATNWIILRVI